MEILCLNDLIAGATGGTRTIMPGFLDREVLSRNDGRQLYPCCPPAPARLPPPGTMVRTVAYNSGIKIRFKVVAAIIPPNTVVPTEMRPAFPAPVASTSGTT